MSSPPSAVRRISIISSGTEPSKAIALSPSVSCLGGFLTAARRGPSTSVTGTNTVTIKGRSYTTPRDSARRAPPGEKDEQPISDAEVN
jgi:hypothetical protein